MTLARKKLTPEKQAASKELAEKRAAYVIGRECVIALMKGQRGVPASEVHEIIGGSFRQRTKLDPAYWMAVNRFNHGIVQYMPQARQWALKALFDSENFDIGALSALNGFKVGTAEVLSEIVMVQRLRPKVRI